MNRKSIDHLLKSSLPLEHQISALSSQNKFFNNGEFSYSRKNEDGYSTDFSVDLLISTEMHEIVHGIEVEKNLNLLIECKYASPSVAWVFSTAPKHEPLIMTAFSTYPWIGSHLMQGFEPMKSLEPQVYCTRGLSLSATSADPTQIRHGLQQIRYAIPKLLENLLDSYKSYDGPAIPLIAPLLVTNAPLFVLNPDVTISKAEQAESLQEIATEYTHLCVYQKASPELKDFCRTSAIAIIEKNQSENFPCRVDMLVGDLVDAVESIPIVSASYFPVYLNALRDVISKISIESRERILRDYSLAQSASADDRPV
ncbi:hypothetical protein [Burkholderia ubonensis]|uniref:hypothetical protein n=1 Tax=Burkholderia ubonensis TaxID=101571 RepID=UPI000A438493|nr:hypothetical protein [Burkholderia ubonensis]